MAESEPEIDVPAIRKTLGKISLKVQKRREKYSKLLEANNPAVTEVHTLEDAHQEIETCRQSYEEKTEQMEDSDDRNERDQDDADEFHELVLVTKFSINLLLSKRKIFKSSTCLERQLEHAEEAIATDPAGDHSVILSRIQATETKLSEALETTSLMEDDPLYLEAQAIRKREVLLQGKPKTWLKPEDKPVIMTAPVKSTFKVDPVSVPTFSGRTEDWLPFWRMFKKAIDEKKDLDDDIRLTYLIRAMEDPIMRDTYAERVDDPGAYRTIVSELQDEFDKPRWMHRRYWDQLKTLTTIPHTRDAMKELLTKVDSIYKGFNRLKKSDVQYILTSAVEGVMGKELRALWNQRTDTVKEVPPIEELTKFIKAQADQIEQGPKPENPTTSRHQSERPSHSSRYRQRGTTHVTTSDSTSVSSRQESIMPKITPKYDCPLCPEQHYPYLCGKFGEFSQSQRRKHVQDNNLCTVCLKPNHTAANCTNTFKCRYCKGNHNSMLHQDGSTINSTNSAVSPSPRRSHLMMTSQVILTGPTGVSTTARALLDSASTVSMVTSRIMKTLALQRTEEETLITGVAGQTTACPIMTNVTLSSNYKEWKRDLSVAVLKRVTTDLPLQGASSARNLPHLRDLQFADEQFHCPGTIDILLGQDVFGELLQEKKRQGPPGTPLAYLTVFGWAVMGPYIPDKCINPRLHLTATAADYVNETTSNLPPEEILSRLLVMEEPEEKERVFTQEEKMVEEHFEKTHSYDAAERRYTVRLPMKSNVKELGASKPQAINRAEANYKSMKRKGCHTKYQEVMQGYVDKGHARLLRPEEANNNNSAYYMPVHAVFKESSSTTKVRAVFDASAKTTTHKSLNELMAIGPKLQPPLDQTLLRFRMYPVALSGDISQMYREVLLHPDDRRLHRFIWRPDDSQPWQDYEMTRVTFGVTASPYLAVKVLLQAAKDFAPSAEARHHLQESFYVDDFLGGAANPEEALRLYKDLRAVLEQAGFHLKKWRSSSITVLKEIPEDLQESLPQQELIDEHGASYPRALGIAWDSRKDTMATHVSLPSKAISSKRGVISDVARTFDVLGWICPAILPMKLLYRQLWLRKLSWDDQLKEEESKEHEQWRQQLQSLTTINLPRHYFDGQVPTTIELHGFCDASENAFAACVYIRATYSSRNPTSLLVTAKTKVAPLKNRSIPQLELCGAFLLARLMAVVRQALNLEKSQCHAYCDNTTTLAWLTAAPQRFRVFVANRIVNTTALVPDTAWSHVPTQDNPADCATRGLTANELKQHHLWWTGPSWLLRQPVSIPIQPTEEELEKERATEAKPEVCHVSHAAEILEGRVRSYNKLIRVTAWIMRLIHLAHKQPRNTDIKLSLEETQAAETLLWKRSQERSFVQELSRLRATPPKEVPVKSCLGGLTVFLDHTGTLRIGGRLQKSSLPMNQKHPVVLSASDVLTRKMFQEYHLQEGHCGPSSLLHYTADILYTIGARRLARAVCSQCVTCRRAAVRAGPQLMGQLPAPRVEPAAAFSTTGLDLAGPFEVRTSHTRKPVFVKGYMIIFVCFCTKAVHLELVLEQSTEHFVAALERFIARRGLPSHIYSDNGKNFVGAQNELKDVYKMIQDEGTQNAVQSYLLTYKVQWHNSPQRAPHFGGLWEAAVRSAKFHLKRVVGAQRFTYDELLTIFCKVESYMNSRPLGPITSHPTDGVTPLTPGHFLIGRALRAYPQHKVDFKPAILQRWVLCQKTTQQFWKRWSAEYLQQLQRAVKWHKKSRNFTVGDMVMMTDGSKFCAQWSMAKVVAVYPGKDGIVRAADVQVDHAIKPTSYNSREQYLEKLTVKTAVYRRPVSKLSLLLGMDESSG